REILPGFLQSVEPGVIRHAVIAEEQIEGTRFKRLIEALPIPDLKDFKGDLLLLEDGFDQFGVARVVLEMEDVYAARHMSLPRVILAGREPAGYHRACLSIMSAACTCSFPAE